MRSTVELGRSAAVSLYYFFSHISVRSPIRIGARLAINLSAKKIRQTKWRSLGLLSILEGLNILRSIGVVHELVGHYVGCFTCVYLGRQDHMSWRVASLAAVALVLVFATVWGVELAAWGFRCL